MIIRTKYLEAIQPFVNKPIIKVITGVRRCGKSTLLIQLINQLIDRGIGEGQIIYINKELYEFDHIKDYSQLHDYVTARRKPKSRKYYLMVDEIQEIDNWERSVSSLLAYGNLDIFITGSNANLLSSELATLISGRYVEFRMFTLNFIEFCEMFDNSFPIDKKGVDKLELYLKYGGFPGLYHVEWQEEVIRHYLQAIYSTILLKDVIMRYNIRDAALLNQVAEYLIDTTGNITTAKSISDYLKSQRRKVYMDTIQNYIHYFMNAHMVSKVKRLDIKGKKLLETYEKYYLSDLGFRFSLLGYPPEALPGQLENAVFLELLQRGFRVNIGKANGYEIDFVAERAGERFYLQVCATLRNSSTIDREYRSLEKIPDHFPKIVLSLDRGFERNRKGIAWMNLEDFLLGGKL